MFTSLIFYLLATTHLHLPYLPPAFQKLHTKKRRVWAVEVEVIARVGDMCVKSVV